MERRLAAIFAADMVSYSRLVEQDEPGTLTRHQNHLKELIEPEIRSRGGQLVKRTGDGLIAEFPSVVEAVKCAVSVQREMATRESVIQPDRRIHYRIAVNLGDVVFEDGDVFGDGVNIAARLETLADPGGIVVSGTAYDHLKANVDVAYEDLGTHQVKNIATPVRVFRVLLDGSASPSKGSRSWRYLAIALVSAGLLAGLGAWWWGQNTDFIPADPARMEYALDEPSIAVLAFENLTGDPEQENVSDGLSEDIISALARLPGIVVIARSSSFAYKDAPSDVRRIAEDLSVRYVLEGSLQSFGDQVRVNAQLIDAVSGHSIWSKTFDGTRGDFFGLRDEITQNIIAELDSELLHGDAIWSSPEAFGSMDTWLMGKKVMWHTYRFTKVDNQVAIDLLNEILVREPESAWAHAQLAYKYAWIGRAGWGDDLVSAFERGEYHARKAISLNEESPLGHAALGFVRHSEGRYGDAIPLAERALERAPGDAEEMAMLAIYFQRNGQADRSVELFERAARLHRNAPGWFWSSFADSLRIIGRCQDALPVYQKALQQGAAGFIGAEAHLGLAVCHDALGQTDMAREEIAAATQTFPQASVGLMRSAFTFTDETYKENWLATLERLGLPVE